MKGEAGNALFLILIAVALFAALSYAVANSGRGGGSIEREQQMLDTAVAEQCTASVEQGTMRLRLVGGCSQDQISFELPGGGNENEDNPDNTSCFLFHPDGAGLTPCGTYAAVDDSCPLTDLALGEACDAIIFAGESGGNRIYTTPNDESPLTWNNGTGNTNTGATSSSNGRANTNTLVALSDAGAPYRAAEACRSLGEEWYLPSRSEVLTLYSNRTEVGNFASDERYWSSTEASDDKAWVVRFRSGGEIDDREKGLISYRFRCIRQD